MTLEEIASKLESAGCQIKVWNDSRVYVRKTPNGSTADYGYCVAADDIRYITEHITKRAGEISAILRK